MQDRVLHAIAQERSGLTNEELAERLDEYLYSVAPRVTELRSQGLVEDSGLRRLTVRGRPQIVWQASAAGRDLLRSGA